MFFLPINTELRLNKLPIITYAVTLLCLFIYYQQAENNDAINLQLDLYCESLNVTEIKTDKLDLFKGDVDFCVDYLGFLHERSAHGAFGFIRTELEAGEFGGYAREDYSQIMSNLKNHLASFREKAPSSLDSALMHFPNEWNPWRFITSSLAHGSWSHVIFNLIFFIAFAPAIEILINNRLKYLYLLIAISFTTSITYSLTVLISGDPPRPTLGLSGVVMGVIGFSAYLMPHAKIRVLVWLVVLIRNYYIPAWILALWYIGYDTIDMLFSDDYGGINLISHVSGGVSGYLIAMIWFKKRRKEIQIELDDEIDYMRAERVSGSSMASYSGGRMAMENRQNMKQLKKNHNDYMSALHKHVRVNHDSKAMALVIAENDIQPANVEIYEELFSSAKDWGDSQFLLCLGRLVIHMLVKQRKYARALLFIEQCQQVSEEFVLADPQNVLLLAALAKDANKYKLVYCLVQSAFQRYGNYIEHDECALIEIEMLWQHLNEPEKAKQLIATLLKTVDQKNNDKLLAQLNLMSF